MKLYICVNDLNYAIPNWLIIGLHTFNTVGYIDSWPKNFLEPGYYHDRGFIEL